MKRKDGYAKMTMHFLNCHGAVTDSTVIAEFYSVRWALPLFPDLKKREQESEKEKTQTTPHHLIKVEVWDANEKRFKPYTEFVFYV